MLIYNRKLVVMDSDVKAVRSKLIFFIFMLSTVPHKC